MIGQRRAFEALAERAIRGEVAQAYGFFGPRSIGKRTAAIRLTQTLLCERGAPGGCGACLACRKVERGTHPDVRLVTRSAGRKDIAIEQVREMHEDLALRPLEGRWRVVILDDAADLNQYGQDALLKTLEEPPAHAVLLLLTTRPSELHETIRSRLQPLSFRLVPQPEIAAGLRARGAANPDAHAASAAGLPGVGIELASAEAARGERARLEAELYRLISSGLTDRFGWAAELSELPDDTEHDRRRTREIDRRLASWSELLRDAAVAARGELARPLRPGRARETARLAAAAPARDLLEAAMLALRMRHDIDWNANARAMLELFALRLPYSAAVKGA